MKTAELCAGYDGLYLALLAAGWPVELTWVSEVDEDAKTVHEAHHPEVPNVGDLTQADWTTVEEVDLLAGGIPCQPWSRAGDQQGSEDERDLWPVRKLDDDGNPRRGALDAIRELRPRAVLIENVASLLTAEEGTAFGTILADLAQLGYTVSWATVGACQIGACHHRHRVFVLAVRSDCVARVVRPLSDPIAWLASSGRWMRPEVSFFGDSGLVRWPTAGLLVENRAWALPIEVCGVPVVRAARRVEFDGQGDLFDFDEFEVGVVEGAPMILIPTPTARDGDGRGEGSPEYWERRRAEGGRENGLPLGAVAALLGAAYESGHATRFGIYEPAIRRHEAVFGVPAPAPTKPSQTGSPQLAPEFTEWMQGLPSGHLTEHVDRKAAIRMAGNGVFPQHGAYAIAQLTPYLSVFDRVAVAA